MRVIYQGVKRIMQEAKELASESTYEYSAHPLEVGNHGYHICMSRLIPFGLGQHFRMAFYSTWT